MAGIGQEQIASWLAEQIGRVLRIPSSEVDRDLSLAAYGIDSITAAELSGDLEDWLGRSVPATLLFDHPTITKAAAHLCDTPTGNAASAGD